jgi:ATP-binding cassette subfamily C protein
VNIHRFLLSDLLSRLGWRLPVLIAQMTVVGLGEGMSIALFLPLLGRIGIASASDGFANRMLDKGLSLIGAESTTEILAIIIAIAIIQTVLFITLNWWIIGLARHYQSRRQAELFRAFVGAKWSFIVARKAGELANAIITECERLGMAFTYVLSILATAVVVLVYLALSLLIAWQVTLCLVIFAMLSTLAMARFYTMSYRAGRSLVPLNAELQSTLVEQLAAFKIIKATVSEHRAAARIDPLLQHLERINALVTFLPAMVRGLFEFMAVVGLSIIIVFASKGMGVAVGNVVVVLALFARLFPRLTTLQANVHFLNGQVHAFEAVNRLQSAAEAEAEPQDPSSKPLQIALPTNLIVQNLCVKFGQRKVLDRVNMRLAIPGMLAVVGASGAGKSTLVHTLLGLVEPSAGTIRLENYKIGSAPLRAWRHTMGYVPQETMLFHSSVRENLTLANPNASAAEIEMAARRAHAQTFIEALPDGMDTVIGDQGVKLSGGQRQRLGIARALLTRPIVLLLDEAMSALDSESEAEVLRAIEELRKEMGILIVTHRLAPVRTADSICVIEAGRVVESGTWSELMARRTRLHALAEAQSVAAERSVAVVL